MKANYDKWMKIVNEQNQVYFIIKKYFQTFFSLNPRILEHWKNFNILKEFKEEKNYCYHKQWEMTLVIKALGAIIKECKQCLMSG